MDPCATLKAFDDGMTRRDRAAVAEAAGDLLDWLEKGGFSPVGPHGCDWRGGLTSGQFKSYLRACQHIAEMV